MTFQQSGIEVMEFEYALEAYPEVVFIKFVKTFQLQEINLTFDGGKQLNDVRR